jgi:hypothetical protein
MTTPAGYPPTPARPPAYAPATDPPIRPRHPLGLPPGSVRAILSLTVLGLFWALLLLPQEKSAGIPVYLYYLMFLIVGYYFAVRGHTPDDELYKPPLYLPRGIIRFLIVVGSIAVLGWGFYKDPNLMEKLRPDMEAQPYLPVVLLGAFFLGVVVSRVSNALLRGPAGLPAWYQDVQAWVSLLAVLGLAVEVLIQLLIYPHVEPEHRVDLPYWQAILTGIIAFYFGARS